MRKIVVSTYVTLDGVYEDPGGAEDFAYGGWSDAFFDDEAAQYARDQLWASDALLLGRNTYEEFAANWPSAEEREGDFAVRMNTMPKFVATRTRRPLAWNATAITGDVPAEVAALKARPGRDLLMYSSVTLMHTLMRHNLIDEYRFWVHPVVVGTGKRLFPEGTEPATLTLVGDTRLSTGAVILAYRPSRT